MIHTFCICRLRLCSLYALFLSLHRPAGKLLLQPSPLCIPLLNVLRKRLRPKLPHFLQDLPRTGPETQHTQISRRSRRNRHVVFLLEILEIQPCRRHAHLAVKDFRKLRRELRLLKHASQDTHRIESVKAPAHMGGTPLDQHHRHALSDGSQEYLLSIFIAAHGLQIDQEFIGEFFLFPELCEKSCSPYAFSS